MRLFIKVSIVEFRLLLRSFVTLFFALIFPPMMVILFGSIYGNDPAQFFNNRGALDTMLPGYLSISICVIGLMNLPISIGQYRQRKILKRYKATPLSPWMILGGQLFGSLILLIISVFLVLVLAKVVFNYNMDGNIFLFVLTFILTTLSMFSIGFLVASLAKSEKSANLIANILYFPMIFLSGSTFPSEMFPEKMVIYTKFLPLTHGVELMKGVSFGMPISGFIPEISILAGFTIVCTVISVFTFTWE